MNPRSKSSESDLNEKSIFKKGYTIRPAGTTNSTKSLKEEARHVKSSKLDTIKDESANPASLILKEVLFHDKLKVHRVDFASLDRMLAGVDEAVNDI